MKKQREADKQMELMKQGAADAHKNYQFASARKNEQMTSGNRLVPNHYKEEEEYQAQQQQIQ